jgi:hypothetical protein
VVQAQNLGLKTRSELHKHWCAVLGLKLSAEVRLLESSIGRLLKQVTPDVPDGPSLRTQKAVRAARARWDRDRDA